MSNLTQEQKIKVNNFLRSSNQRLLNLIDELLAENKPQSASSAPPVDNNKKLDDLLDQLETSAAPVALPPIDAEPQLPAPKPKKDHSAKPAPQSKPQSPPATPSVAPVTSNSSAEPVSPPPSTTPAPVPIPIITPPPQPSQIFSSTSLDDEPTIPAPVPTLVTPPAPSNPEPVLSPLPPVTPSLKSSPPPLPSEPTPTPLANDATFVNSLLDNLTKK